MKTKSTETFRAWAEFNGDRITSLVMSGPEILDWMCMARERGAAKVGYHTA